MRDLLSRKAGATNLSVVFVFFIVEILVLCLSLRDLRPRVRLFSLPQKRKPIKTKLSGIKTALSIFMKLR